MLYASSVEEVYNDPTGFVCPAIFAKIIPPNEEYITHATFRKTKNHGEKTYTFILTKTNYYKVDPEFHNKIWCRNISEIASVSEDPDNPYKFKMIYRKTHSSTVTTSVKSYMSKDKDKDKDKDKASTLMSSFASERYLIAESNELRDEWILVIRKLLRDHWQILLENSFVPTPEVYQAHFFVEKVNRKGKSQIRCLVISTVRIYNIEVKNGVELGKTKWNFPITTLTNLYVYNQPSNVLVMKINTSHLQKMKPLTNVILRDQNERDLFAAEIRRLYFQKKKYHLPKEVGATWDKGKLKSKLSI